MLLKVSFLCTTNDIRSLALTKYSGFSISFVRPFFTIVLFSLVFGLLCLLCVCANEQLLFYIKQPTEYTRNSPLAYWIQWMSRDTRQTLLLIRCLVLAHHLTVLSFDKHEVLQNMMEFMKSLTRNSIELGLQNGIELFGCVDGSECGGKLCMCYVLCSCELT